MNSETPKVGILGYYGPDELMNEATLSKLVQQCVEIILHDFQLSKDNFVLVYNGSTWANYLPIEIAVHLDLPGKCVEMIVPAPWDIAKAKFAHAGTGKVYNHSHYLMNQRLGRVRGDTTYRCISTLLRNGANLVSERGIGPRDKAIAEACDYLIYVPLNEADKAGKSHLFGEPIYKSFDPSKKRIVCISDYQ